MKALDKYIEEMSSPEPPLLAELTRATHQRAIHPQMLSGHVQGKLLEMIVRMLRPHRVLEIGTFTGYSSLSMAAGLEDGALLDTIEADDEQEDMIEQYLERGTMYVLDDDGIQCECVVTDEGHGILEIKNIATKPEAQGKGYGRILIDFIVEKYKEKYSVLQVGTGDSPLTIPFYEKCGFIRSHSIQNFFIDHYDHPIYEQGNQLIDMIYLQRKL